MLYRAKWYIKVAGVLVRPGSLIAEGLEDEHEAQRLLKLGAIVPAETEEAPAEAPTGAEEAPAATPDETPVALGTEADEAMDEASDEPMPTIEELDSAAKKGRTGRRKAK